MAVTAASHGIRLPDRELACAPIRSALGQQYLGAMRAAINCALANRQMATPSRRRTATLRIAIREFRHWLRALGDFQWSVAGACGGGVA